MTAKHILYREYITAPIKVLDKIEKKNWIFSNEYFIRCQVVNGNDKTVFTFEVNENDFRNMFFIGQEYKLVFKHDKQTNKYLPARN